MSESYESIEEILPKVRTAIARSCDLDPSEVELGKTLVGDFEMESLDFVDLIFELEQAFAITIPMGDIDAEIEAAMDGVPHEVDGILTREGLAKLKELVPALSFKDKESDVGIDEVPMLLTVESICGLLLREQHKRRSEQA